MWILTVQEKIHRFLNVGEQYFICIVNDRVTINYIPIMEVNTGDVFNWMARAGTFHDARRCLTCGAMVLHPTDRICFKCINERGGGVLCQEECEEESSDDDDIFF